jgi:hypothetical protein
MNKIVARFTDNRLVKDETSDFVPAKKMFHIAMGPAESKPVEIRIQT